MKIAAITCFFNDYVKIDQFSNFYEEYRNSLSYHVIIDNNSNDDFKQELLGRFADRSYIILLNKNKGTTGAYNSGINYLLKNTDCDSILILANDVRIIGESIVSLHHFLYSDHSIGVVGPALLRRGSLNLIEEYGGYIDKNTILVNKNIPVSGHLEDITAKQKVDFIAGGINMAKREVYERIGIQDEGLFMYGDEVDWDIRVSKESYELWVTSEAIAWHEHLNSLTQDSEFRDPLYYFYHFRNRLILGRKYGSKSGFNLLVKDTYRYFRDNYLNLLKKHKYKLIIAFFFGVIFGMLGIKKRFIY